MDSSSLSRASSRAVRSAPTDAPGWLSTLGKAGYISKGTVYVLVGGLALAAAFELGGSIGGSKNALAEIASAPFGGVILAVVSLGLFAYAALRMLQGWVDPGHEGDDASGISKRVTYAINGSLHAALGVYGASIVFGSSSAQASGGGGSEETASTLMQQPGGIWIVGILGAIIIGFGLRQAYRAYSVEFMDNYDHTDLDADKARVVKRLGQAGLGARAFVFLLIGAFFVRAALQADPSLSGGLGEALHSLLEQPFGKILLGVVAAGLACYGVFCFSYARYRDFARS